MARDNYKRETGRGHRPERRISVRGVRRQEPDLRKLAQTLIALAQAQAEAEAQAQVADTTAIGGGLPGDSESKEAA